MKPKSLLCLYRSKVLCQHVRDTNFDVVYRCLECKFYAEFVREIEAEEDEFFEELDRIVESGKLDG